MKKKQVNIQKLILKKDVSDIIANLGWVDWEGGWPSFSIHNGDVDISVSYYKQIFSCTFFISAEFGNTLAISFYSNRDGEVDFINLDKDIVESVMLNSITEEHMKIVCLSLENLPLLEDLTCKMHSVIITLMG